MVDSLILNHSWYLQLHGGRVVLGIHLQRVSAGQWSLSSAWPGVGVSSSMRSSWLFSRLLSWQLESTVSYLCSIFGEKYLLLQSSLLSPHLWTPVLADRNLEGPDEAIETLRLSALCPSLPSGNAEEAWGTDSVPRINNWKINLSFPCHKLKAYRPYNMSIIEVSGYWWRSQSSLSRAHLYCTI